MIDALSPRASVGPPPFGIRHALPNRDMFGESHREPRTSESAERSAHNAAREHIGERLRGNIEDLLARYVTRLRGDPLTPMARPLARPLLEDHAMSCLSDVFQTLVILEKAKDLGAEEEYALLEDGTEIQQLVSGLHGRQRHRLGWTEAALEREYQIIVEEVGSLARRHATDDQVLAWALEILNRQLERARKASLAGFSSARDSG